MPYTSNLFGTFYSLNKVNNDNPIVFVHGVGLNHEIWKPQIDFFKEYCFEVSKNFIFKYQDFLH